MTRIATALLILIPVTVAGPALAEENVQLKDFGTLDTDKDGKISGGEAQADTTLAEAFVQADRNKDGALTQQEYAGWLAQLKKSQKEVK
jgi:hypothetical protein